MKIPFLDFRITNHSNSYAMSVYVAGYTVDRRFCQSQEEGKAIAEEWLANLKTQIDSLLEGEE